ncbi:MAG: hypothetical protein JWM96_361 [Alphaproteobacteria bacterium]|nr:hypothetical protein [Alphaproteobacteria bacterium]
MELNSARPALEPANTAAATAMSATKFKERRVREAQSDVKNEAVYFSPVIRIDKDTQAAVIQYRDSQTGEVKNQYPNKTATAYQRAEETSPPEQAPPAKAAEEVEEPEKAPEPAVDEKA